MGTPDPMRRPRIWTEEALSICGLHACAAAKAGYSWSRGSPSFSKFFPTPLLSPTMIGIHPMERPAVAARWEPETHYSSLEFIRGEILDILLPESDCMIVFKNRLTPTGDPNYISLEAAGTVHACKKQVRRNSRDTPTTSHFICANFHHSGALLSLGSASQLQ